MRRPNYRHPHLRPAGGQHQIVRRRRRLGEHVPRRVYRELILEILLEAPGYAMPSREMRKTVAQRLRNQFTAVDLSARSGGPLWVNEMQWVKKQLLMKGLMENVLTAGHGIWELTRRGIQEARGARV